MNATWIVIQSKEHLEKVTRHGKVMVGFGASWCHNSQQLEHTLRSSVGEMNDITVAWVDATQVDGAGHRFGIFSVPALVTFSDGVPTEYRSGNIPKIEIQQLYQHNQQPDWEEDRGMEYLSP